MVGEGEEAIVDVVDAYQAWQEAGEDKQSLLIRLAAIPGIYVPSLYDVNLSSGRDNPEHHTQ